MTELATQENGHAPAKRPPTISDLVASDAFKRKIANVLPKHLTPDRFVRVALLAMSRTPKLRECTQESLLGALMTLSQFGLEPDGRRAHLIPFKRNVKHGDRWESIMEVQLIIDYKGLAELVMRSGLVSNIHADIVCDNDDFDYDRGEIKHHRINLKAPRGPMYAAYVIVRMRDGGEKIEVMGKEDIDSIRARSKSKDNGPWVTDYNEMAKKTVFRRASKWLSLSPEFRDALEAEEAHDPIVVEAAASVPVPVNDDPPRRMRMRSQPAAIESGPSGDEVMDELTGGTAAATGPAAAPTVKESPSAPEAPKRGPGRPRREQTPEETQKAREELAAIGKGEELAPVEIPTHPNQPENSVEAPPSPEEQRAILAQEFVDSLPDEKLKPFIIGRPKAAVIAAMATAGISHLSISDLDAGQLRDAIFNLKLAESAAAK